MFCPERLLKELDRAEIIEWALELKYGMEAYSFLISKINNKDLNANQTRNALHALFKIHSHGSVDEVLQVFLELTSHDNVSVRSEAVKLFIGLFLLNNQFYKDKVTLKSNSMFYKKIKLNKEQLIKINTAIAVGLNIKTKKMAKVFLKNIATGVGDGDRPFSIGVR